MQEKAYYIIYWKLQLHIEKLYPLQNLKKEETIRIILDRTNLTKKYNGSS